MAQPPPYRRLFRELAVAGIYNGRINVALTAQQQSYAVIAFYCATVHWLHYAVNGTR